MLPEPLPELPTAKQLIELVQDTASRSSLPVPLFGLGTIDHALPFHDSMRLLDIPEPEGFE